MRAINKLIVHCSATPPSMYCDAATIRDWHVNKNGWSDIGYHYVICRDGAIEAGRDEGTPGAHAKGFNGESIGICLVGGVDENNKPQANFTASQYASLESILRDLLQSYPGAKVLGHRDLPNVAKDCPCFDAPAFAENIA